MRNSYISCPLAEVLQMLSVNLHGFHESSVHDLDMEKILESGSKHEIEAEGEIAQPAYFIFQRNRLPDSLVLVACPKRNISGMLLASVKKSVSSEIAACDVGGTHLV